MFINGQDVGDLADATVGANLQDKLDAINEAVTGVTVGAITELTATSEGDGVVQGAEYIQIALANPDGTTNQLQIGNTGSMDEFVAKVNEVGQGQVTASLTEEGYLSIQSDVGATITLTASGATLADVVGSDMGTAQQAQLTLTAENGTDGIEVTYTTAADANATGVDARTEVGSISGRTALTCNW